MKTAKQILKKMEDHEGFTSEEYLQALKYSSAKPYLPPEVTEKTWEPYLLTDNSVLEFMEAYMPLAWEVANNKLFIRSNISIINYTIWTWLLGNDEFSKKLKGLLKNHNEYYGKGILVTICEEHDWEWASEDDGKWATESSSDVVTYEDAFPGWRARTLNGKSGKIL